MNYRWLLRRIGVAIIIFFVALFITFVIPRAMPGEPIDYMSLGLSDEQALEVKERMGLLDPIHIQFIKYVKNVFTGYWGYSLMYKESVTDMLFRVLPFSLSLIIPAMIIQAIIAFFLGVDAGWKAGGKRDAFTQALSLSLWSTPMFWLAMLAIFIFSVKLGWFPQGGAVTAAAEYNNWLASFGDRVYHSILPILCLVVNQFGGYQLIMRNTMVTTIRENYVVTAEAKGLSENKVKYKHAARNAMLPMITSFALRVSLAITGSIFTEIIFSFPGIGRTMLEAVTSSDYPVLGGAFFMLAVSVIISMLLVDMLYTRLDPRIRY